MPRIVRAVTHDVRFPTSLTGAGSDAMNPVRVEKGQYRAPEAPGYSIEMKPESLAEFAFPDGPAWDARGSAR